MYGRVATLKDQLIAIANTLAWVSVENGLREICAPMCPGGSAAYDRCL